jgi:phage FluMu gp28-like protein
MTALTLRAEYLVETLDLPAATGVEDAHWEAFQLEHLNDDSQFRIENKSRQIAWSFTSAAESVADAHLTGRSSIFASINLDEAKEKIRYARAVHENIQLSDKPAIVRDNELGLEFDNGARLLSLPARPPRGKARMNIYLDEFAHVQHDRQIYTAALPIISKGGRLRMGSSPLGASGVFWEVFSEAIRPYSGYTRKRTPWWEVRAFSLNVKEARHKAPAMLTGERVARYGRDAIKAIFDNMPLEDFQQEYEAEFVDESTAWITWEELKAVQSDDLVCFLASGTGKDLTRTYEAIEQLARAGVESAFGVGVDVGRTRNTTEVFIIGLSSVSSYPLRLTLTLDNVEFNDQQEVLERVLSRLPVVKMLIDQNGIGRNLAENLARKYPTKAEGVDFTNATKQVWATDAKMLVQQRKTPLPPDRDIAYQIHSIKKTVTASKNNVFDTARNEKHHADKFWAWALGLSACRTDPLPTFSGQRPSMKRRI